MKNKNNPPPKKRQIKCTYALIAFKPLLIRVLVFSNQCIRGKRNALCMHYPKIKCTEAVHFFSQSAHVKTLLWT